MSFKLDLVFRNNYSACFNVPKTPAHSVGEQILLAKERMTSAQRDKYAKIVVMSMYWETDDTGGKKDCDLFIQTISKLQPEITESTSFPLKDDVNSYLVASEMMYPLTNFVKGNSENEKALFILHYAGHGWGSSDSLHLCCRIQDVDAELGGPSLEFNTLKVILKAAAMDNPVDVLFLMDCCCAGAGGRGRQRIKGGRVEFMAATTDRGISNSREDGQTFTQSWCAAFEELLDNREAFTTEDIKIAMESQRELAQCPRVIVLHEGMDLPIMFRPGSSTEVTATATIVKCIIAAFHLEEDPDHPKMEQLIQFLDKSDVPVSVLSLVRISSTCLLLRMPAVFEDFLELVPFLAFTE